MKSLWTLLTFVMVLLNIPHTLAQGICCQIKNVPGNSPQSGKYYLVGTSGKTPDYCNGGCVYTKEDDENPGANYCFKDGNLDTSCARGSEGDVGNCSPCTDIKDWIKDFFKEECEMRANAELNIMVRRDYERCGSSDYCGRGLDNATVTLYRGSDNCTGKPYEVGTTEKPSGCYPYGETNFLIAIQKVEPWSVYVEKEGYKPKCQMVYPRIFSSAYSYIYLDPLPKMRIKTLLLDFEFESTYELLPDVKVMSTPLSCTNDSSGSGGSGYNPGCGSGYYPPGFGSGYSSCGCNPTCEYEAWVTDPRSEPCDCQGVIGGGLNFTDLQFSNTTNPFNSGGLNGSIYWYNETEKDGENDDLNKDKFFLVYGVFNRRGNETEEVCESEMSLTLKYPDSDVDKIERSVPCLPPQIPTTPGPPTWPTYSTTKEPEPEPEPTSVGYPTGSGYPPGSGYTSGSGSGSPSPAGYPWGSGSGSGYPIGYFPSDLKEEYENMFTEVSDSLVFGNGDQYWFVACMKGASLSNIITLPSFFSSKSPEETPSFCGRVFAMFGESLEELTVEDVKVCYVDALLGDMPLGGYGQREGRSNPGGKKKKKKPTKKHPKKKGGKPKNFPQQGPRKSKSPSKKIGNFKPSKGKGKGKKNPHYWEEKQFEKQLENQHNNGRHRRDLEEDELELNSWRDNDDEDDEEDEFHNYFGKY